jgi:hypothetical protein
MGSKLKTWPIGLSGSWQANRVQSWPPMTESFQFAEIADPAP